MRIRSFHPTDRLAIMEISKHTWGGYDQLPYELDGLIANPNSYLYVLEYKSRVVAFANLNIIDDGKTGWMEHMRVHYRYRKRGFAWAMTQHLLSEAEGLNIERLRLATTIENDATLRITNRIGMRQILQMKLFAKDNFRGIRWKDTSITIEPCTIEDASALLKTQPNLIPKNILIHYWHAFDLTKSYLISLGEQFQLWKGEVNGKLRTLIFAYVKTHAHAPLWCSTIYALDDSSFYSALSQQLQAAKMALAQSVLCFHSSPFQGANKIPGLKRNTFSSILVLLEKQHPFLHPC
ncbi:MAG: GNAT family N-acetyltransferase [Candidatus Thorarchaeota archaeon]